jgi:hypothetical protein
VSQSDNFLREYNVRENIKIIQYNSNIPLNKSNRILLKKIFKEKEKLVGILQRPVALLLGLSADGINERRLYAQK